MRDVVPLSPPAAVAEFPVADPSMRVYVPVVAGDAPARNLVLDTGSAKTILTRRALAAAGVVALPDPPVHVKPPFLPEDTYDEAIVDRLLVGPLDLHGVPVLVARDDGPFAGDEAGLLGMDVMSRFVVDVDGPASAVRFWPRDRFDARGFTDVAFWGASHDAVAIVGAVKEIGRIPVLVDTGAPLNLIVGGPRMHVLHPRHRGDESIELHEGDDVTDYASEIDGFSLGPFALPRMPVEAHERHPDVPFLDGDSALVGLGVLRHFRFAIDTKNEVFHIAPGPSYYVLARLGIEIDDRNGAPTVTRIVDGEHAWQKPLREGDVVREVDGRLVGTRDEALSAIAAGRGDVALVVLRQGNAVRMRLSLE
jgi:hypothetical protein